jgi:type II secretory pathway pseudopilin PulG
MYRTDGVWDLTLVPVSPGKSWAIVKMRNKTSGFSILEIVSALVILAVVAGAAAATLAPRRMQPNSRRAADELVQLNDLSRQFTAENGHLPKNVNDLVRAGYLPLSGPGSADRIRRIRRNYQYSPTTGTFSPQ